MEEARPSLPPTLLFSKNKVRICTSCPFFRAFTFGAAAYGPTPTPLFPSQKFLKFAGGIVISPLFTLKFDAVFRLKTPAMHAMRTPPLALSPLSLFLKTAGGLSPFFRPEKLMRFFMHPFRDPESAEFDTAAAIRRMKEARSRAVKGGGVKEVKSLAALQKELKVQQFLFCTCQTRQIA